MASEAGGLAVMTPKGAICADNQRSLAIGVRGAGGGGGGGLQPP